MPKTVLYIHGLESGPHGRKARNLASAGFAVVSDLMPCGRAQIARDGVVIAGAAGTIAVLAGSVVLGGPLGLVLAVGLAGVAAPFVKSRLLRRVVRRSVGVQARALAAHRIDAVVGSSFGGAIALELLARGLWSGPTVLLCPAQRLITQRAWLPPPPSLAALPEAVSARVLVVHGRRDATVPMAHSQSLVEGSQARLVLVDDDHRLSAVATPDQLAEWIAMAEGGAGELPR